MNTQHTISVVMPTHNCAHFIAQALDSVLAQTVPVSEIIVVDDGSKDMTVHVLAPYGRRIRYFHLPCGGIAKARNRGLAEARGTLIAFLDADDRWLPDKLAKQLDCLAANQDVDLVHTDLFHCYEPSGKLKYVSQGRERYAGNCYREFFWHCRVLTSSVLVTRRALDSVGPFDEHIPGGRASDMDMFLRIARRFRLAFVPETLVLYRLHDGNVTRSASLMAQSSLYVYRKALANDPTLWEVLGRHRVREWMRLLAFNTGYAFVEIDDLKHGRQYLKFALNYSPAWAYAWMLLISSYLPVSVRRTLRAFKRWTVGRRAAADISPFTT